MNCRMYIRSHRHRSLMFDLLMVATRQGSTARARARNGRRRRRTAHERRADDSLPLSSSANCRCPVHRPANLLTRCLAASRSAWSKQSTPDHEDSSRSRRWQTRHRRVMRHAMRLGRAMSATLASPRRRPTAPLSQPYRSSARASAFAATGVPHRHAWRLRAGPR